MPSSRSNGLRSTKRLQKSPLCSGFHCLTSFAAVLRHAPSNRTVSHSHPTPNSHSLSHHHEITPTLPIPHIFAEKRNITFYNYTTSLRSSIRHPVPKDHLQPCTNPQFHFPFSAYCFVVSQLHLSSNGDLNLNTGLDVDDDLLNNLGWGVKAV